MDLIEYFIYLHQVIKNFYLTDLIIIVFSSRFIIGCKEFLPIRSSFFFYADIATKLCPLL